MLPQKHERGSELGALKGSVSVFRSREHFTQKSIHRIFQDQYGVLWFGTQDGVVAFDGQSFRRYSQRDGLTSNHVVAIAEDLRGRLWFGTHAGGVSVWDREKSGVEQLSGFTKGMPVGLSDVRDIVAQGEHLFLATNRGVVRINTQNDESTVWLPDVDCNCVVWSQDRLLVGAKTGAFVVNANGEVSVSYGKSDSLPRPDVSCIVEDATGLWLGTYGGGLTRLVEGQPPTRYTRTDGLGSDQVMCALRDPSGELWFGTWAGGVTRVKARQFGNRCVFSSITTRDGLGNDNIRALMFDRDSRAWVGTGGAGAACIEQSSKRRFFTSLRQVDGLSHDMVASIAQDDRDRLWFGTFGGGVACYDPKNGARPWTSYGPKEGLGHVTVRCALFDGDGRLWFGTAGGGLTRHHTKTLEWKTFTTNEGLPGNTVRCARKVGNELWFGTDGGVALIDAKVGVGFRSLGADAGLPPSTVVAIAEWRGSIFVATLSEGLYRRAHGETRFSRVTEMASASLLCLAPSESTLFVGTHGDGLFAFTEAANADQPAGLSIRQYTQQDGLPHDIVYSLAHDFAGGLWGGTVLGAFRLSDERFSRFDVSDGLADDECNGGAIFVDKSARVWLGTIGGASYVLPQEVPAQVAPAALVLRRVMADGKPVGIAEGARIPADHKTILFDLSCVDQLSPDKAWWQVRLAGFDEWWAPRGGELIRYTHLPLGEYAFEAQSRAWTGHLGEVLRFRFVVS